MSGFASMKRNASKSLDAVKASAEKLNKGSGYKKDERFWTPTVDKAGNASATIRFLPPSDTEDTPFVKKSVYAWQGPNGWYVNNSLGTLGQDDPCQEYLNGLWATGLAQNQVLYKARKAKKRYISNIYVVTDPGNPENEGKVFLYQYGAQIFNMLNAVMYPDNEDKEEDEIVEAFNPFDLWTGANFRFKQRKTQNGPNYEKSTLAPQGPLLDDDDKLEEIWKQQYLLAPEIAPDKFESYDVLKKRLNKVLGETTRSNDYSDEDFGHKEPNSFKEEKEPEQKEDDNFFSQFSEKNFDDDDEIPF